MCVRVCVSKGLAGLGAGAGRGNKTPRGLKGPHETVTHSRRAAEPRWLSGALCPARFSSFLFITRLSLYLYLCFHNSLPL